MQHRQLDFPRARTSGEQEIKAIDELVIRSAAHRSSERYFALLQFINRFPRLSPFNAFLVHTQNPGVSVLATAHQWFKNYGRTVRRHARPLVILVPFGPVSFVYDIADTDGPPVPQELINPFATTGDIPYSVLETSFDNCSREKIKIIEAQLARGAAGYASVRHGHFTMTINKVLAKNEKYSTFVHELGHIYCGHLGTADDYWWPDRSNLARDVREIEAESIAFLVCKRAGLKTSSEEYLSNYIRQNETVPPFSLETVLTLAGYIERMGKEKLNPRRPHRPRRQ